MILKNYILRKLNLLLIGLVISVGVYAGDITTGLKLYYSFDNITSTTVTDDSGNGADGMLEGAMATPVEGYMQYGVAGTEKADYIKLPANFTQQFTSFTFACWANFSVLKNATRFFDFGNGADASNDYLCFLPSNGDNSPMRLRYRPTSGTSYNVDATSVIPTNAWAHVALTFNWDASSTMATVIIYINGAQVGTGTMPFNPSMLGETADNYLSYSRWNQDSNGLNGTLDEVRFYNRALSAADVLDLSGLSELNNQFSNLTEDVIKLNNDDLKQVTTNLNLPTTLGTQGVKVDWASSNKAALDTLGNVTQPAVYNAPVNLTATLTHVVNGKTYTMTKPFTVIVLGVEGTPEEIAQWDFSGNITVEDGEVKATDNFSGFVGTLKNEARIRTIGSTDQYNVLDLGNGTGYFDMGTEIGKAIYSLTNYTVCGYFRIDDDYSSLGNNGNFYWTFSNSDDAATDQNGYMFGSLMTQGQTVSTNYWSTGNQSVAVGTTAPKGAWHHMAYVQNGNTGTLYIDGEAKESTSMTNLPGLAIPKEGFTGTLYNWLGRSNYVGDSYLRKTLLYDFRILGVSLSQSDLNLGYMEVPSTIELLNNAYTENPDFISNDLTAEADNLTLGDLSQVISNLTLPTEGTIDPNITITWKSSNPQLITDNGVVTRPDYYNYVDTLTATLFQGGQSVDKKFYATVLKNEGTEFTGNLLVRYDFSQVSDTTVTDVAEKHFQGTLEAGAKVITMGSGDTQYDVLSLGDSIGYFDMGKKVGQIMYNINDYTISAYYRIDTAYHEMSPNGNFLWNFSNSAGILHTAATGYMIASLRNQANSITANNWTGEQTVKLGAAALQGGWHNMTYVQKDTIGSIYIDGVLQASSDAITQTPANTLPHEGNLGTIYNWIGRSCYEDNVYLRNTLVYDLRVYDKALTEEEITNSELNVGEVLNKLEVAYALGTSLPVIESSKYKIATSRGAINILGLKGTEKVSLFDISGRKINQDNKSSYKVNPGIYVVRINDSATKIIVQ